MLPEKTTDKTAAREVALKLLERAKAMMQVSLSGLERDQLAIANHWAFYAISNAMTAFRYLPGRNGVEACLFDGSAYGSK